jgi:hypothetical protein
MKDDRAVPKQQVETGTPTADQLVFGEKWLQLVRQAQADKALKQRLIETPIAVLQEHGIKVREGLEIRVVEAIENVENTDKIVYLTLRPDDLELTEGDFEAIAGGRPLREASERSVCDPRRNAQGHRHVLLFGWRVVRGGRYNRLRVLTRIFAAPNRSWSQGHHALPVRELKECL